MFLSKTSRIIRRSFSALQSVHEFGMQKRFDLDIASIALQKAATQIYRNHPGSANRLTDIHGATFLIKVNDFPLNLLFTLHEQRILVDCNIRHQPKTDVQVRGDLKSLIEVFEGNEDADALFFSRRLSIEGNVETLVTLRNAIDSEDIDLMKELSELFGPFSKPANGLLQQLHKHYQQTTVNMQ